MFKFLIVISSVAVYAALAQSNDDDQWAAWKNQRGRGYANAGEETKRRAIWARSKEFVDAHNAKPINRRGPAFIMELNEFADMDEEERAQRRGAQLPPSETIRNRGKRQARKRTTKATTTKQTITTNIGNISTTQSAPATTTRPGTFNGDWRTYAGKLTPIKNQGTCGSCWAFATTGVLESRYAIAKNATASSYSEQHLVDCSLSNYYNYGCAGGWPNNALIYVRDVAGVNLASAYPYSGVQASSCQMKTARYAATASSAYTKVAINETAIMQALATGPLIAAIDVDSAFEFYRSGVYSSTTCNSNGSTVDHAVIIVGYGSDATRGNFWIVRNSWGTGWGESGYIRMARGPNTCNIMSYVSFPNLV